MSRVPRWTTDEIAVLERHYRDIGARACAEQLPRRTPGSVAMKAHDLGLSRRHQPAPPKPAAPRARQPRIDLRGQRFGALVVVGEGERTNTGKLRWLCRCDCGRDAHVKGGNLRRAQWPKRDCGCGVGGGRRRAYTPPRPEPEGLRPHEYTEPPPIRQVRTDAELLDWQRGRRLQQILIHPWPVSATVLEGNP